MTGRKRNNQLKESEKVENLSEKNLMNEGNETQMEDRKKEKSKEKEQVQEVQENSEDESEEPDFEVQKGKGTPLKDIPNVVYKLKQQSASFVAVMHSVLYGFHGEERYFKENILQFSGFARYPNEENQKDIIKERLEKLQKETLARLCSVCDLTIRRFLDNVKKSKIVDHLLEYLEAPYAINEDKFSCHEVQMIITGNKKLKESGKVDNLSDKNLMNEGNEIKMEDRIKEKSKEKEQVKLVQENSEDESEESDFEVLKGEGMSLKDIPNVVYKLKQQSASFLSVMHGVLYGLHGEEEDFKENILQFSGFAQYPNEESQKDLIKGRLEKLKKETLARLCSVFDLTIPRLLDNVKKNKIVELLLEFMEAPYAIKEVKFSCNEKLPKERELKRKINLQAQKQSGRTMKRHCKGKYSTESDARSSVETSREETDEEYEEVENDKNALEVTDKDKEDEDEETEENKEDEQKVEDDKNALEETEEEKEDEEIEKNKEDEQKVENDKNALEEVGKEKEAEETEENKEAQVTEEHKEDVEIEENKEYNETEKNKEDKKTEGIKEDEETEEHKEYEETEENALVDELEEIKSLENEENDKTISENSKDMDVNSAKESLECKEREDGKTKENDKNILGDKQKEVETSENEENNNTTSKNSKDVNLICVKEEPNLEKFSYKRVAKGGDRSPKEWADPSSEELKKGICDILDQTDITIATFSDVLDKLEEYFEMDLSPRKEAIMLMIEDELYRRADEAQDTESSEEHEDDKGKVKLI